MSIQSPLVWQQEESETGFTRDKTYTYTNSNWNNQLNIIPAYSKVTKVIARIRYRSSTGSGNFEFYVGGTKYASGTAPASSKEEEFDVTSKFITSGSNSGELNGEMKFRFYSSIIYKYQLGFVRLTWTYDAPVFVVNLSKTGEGTVSGAGERNFKNHRKRASVSAAAHLRKHHRSKRAGEVIDRLPLIRTWIRERVVDHLAHIDTKLAEAVVRTCAVWGCAPTTA